MGGEGGEGGRGGGRESYNRNQRGFLDVERKLLLCTAKIAVDR
jgi:hypothetical protein